MTTANSEPGELVIGRRWLLLIPVASVMYLLAFIDRTNLSFVLPQLGKELGLSDTDKGLVSGVFFLGYVLFQVPAAILAERWSAKYIVFIVMILWGLTAMATGLVSTVPHLLIARFLLGVFEGAVQPTVLVLLTRWFPQRERARASGFWLLCLPFAGVVGAPLTGWLLDMFDWRTVLIVEGIPPILWAFVWLAVIADVPGKARWLSPGERDHITTAIERDEQAKPAAPEGKARYRDALRNRRTMMLVAAWFCYNFGFYGFTLWLPQVITDLTGRSPGLVGLLTAVPYLIGLIAMIVISTRTDRQGSRPLSAAGPLTVAALALLLGPFLPAAGQLAMVCVVAAGLYIHGAFFALPPLVIRTELLAVSLGLIGGLGNIGGFFGPYAVGWLSDVTGSKSVGFAAMSLALLGCAVLLGLVSPRGGAATEQAATDRPGVRAHLE